MYYYNFLPASKNHEFVHMNKKEISGLKSLVGNNSKKVSVSNQSKLNQIKKQGRGGDTEIASIPPLLIKFLNALIHHGKNQVNPHSGLREYVKEYKGNKVYLPRGRGFIQTQNNTEKNNAIRAIRLLGDNDATAENVRAYLNTSNWKKPLYISTRKTSDAFDYFTPDFVQKHLRKLSDVEGNNKEEKARNALNLDRFSNPNISKSTIISFNKTGRKHLKNFIKDPSTQTKLQNREDVTYTVPHPLPSHHEGIVSKASQMNNVYGDLTSFTFNPLKAGSVLPQYNGYVQGNHFVDSIQDNEKQLQFGNKTKL